MSERDKTARILLLSPILRFDFVHNGSRPGITTGLYNRTLSEIERVFFVKESTMPGVRLNIRTNNNCLIFIRVCVKWCLEGKPKADQLVAFNIFYFCTGTALFL